MTLTHIRCTDCSYKDVKAQRTYTIKQGEGRDKHWNRNER